jgi:hypothetical protein
LKVAFPIFWSSPLGNADTKKGRRANRDRTEM